MGHYPETTNECTCDTATGSESRRCTFCVDKRKRTKSKPKRKRKVEAISKYKFDTSTYVKIPTIDKLTRRRGLKR